MQWHHLCCSNRKRNHLLLYIVKIHRLCQGALGAELQRFGRHKSCGSTRWVTPLQALRKTDDFSRWVCHSDRLSRRDAAHQAQAVPAVGRGWKNLSGSINVHVIPRVCVTFFQIPNVPQAKAVGDMEPRKSALPLPCQALPIRSQRGSTKQAPKEPNPRKPL